VSKPKTIFTILADLTHKKVDSTTYTESDWKAYNAYMVNKWLSMNADVTEIINFTQKYYSLDKKVHFKMLSDILPNQKIFSKYIKGIKSDKFNPELVTIISNHYEVSKTEAKSYIDLYTRISDGVSNLTSILEMYGKTKKEIKKLLK
jgi:translation initiation factor 2 alpha subunit (eIF-2alpha)